VQVSGSPDPTDPTTPQLGENDNADDLVSVATNNDKKADQMEASWKEALPKDFATPADSKLLSQLDATRKAAVQATEAAGRLLSRDPSEDRISMPETDERHDGEREIKKHGLAADDALTPEAIFRNKHIAPEIAEFLGHLAQHGRVARKEDLRALHRRQEAAGLTESGVAHARKPSAEDSDDSDDIEDMKKAAARQPKQTALSNFLEKIDSKDRASAWLPTECAALAQNVTEKYGKMFGKTHGTWATVGPASAAGRAEIHTGMFFKHWGIGKDAARKLRLSVLSFLATQDAGRVKLHIWTDEQKNSDILKSMLGPIMHRPEFLDAINITTFDHKAEFDKVAPSLAKSVLAELYKKDSAPELRPDLFRSIILYNYGGMWMDADTMLMQDMSPLMGEDWAYLQKGKGSIEGALLSASKPQSHFTTSYLISLVMREPPLDGEEQKPLLSEVFEKDPSRTTLHVLPPCFFDSDPAPETTAVLAETASSSPFFGTAVPEAYRSFFADGIKEAIKDNSTQDASVLQMPSPAGQDEEEDKPAAAPVWAYHWRGNFGASWARGSFADVAERTFMKKLQIHYANQYHH